MGPMPKADRGQSACEARCFTQQYFLFLTTFTYAVHAQGWLSQLIQGLLLTCKCACLSAVCTGSKYLHEKSVQ